MRITIQERLCPLTHLPGTWFPLMGTRLKVRVFPTRIEVGKDRLNLTLRGPINKWTACLDIERGKLKGWGHSQEGYFQWSLRGQGTSWVFQFDRGATPSLSILLNGEETTLPKGETLSNGEVIPQGVFFERLSLGMHKKQDWEGVKKRGDLREVFPHWVALGQNVPGEGSIGEGGTLDLLNECQKTPSPDLVLGHFQNLWLGGFDGVLSPRLVDSDYQGLVYSEPKNADEWALLSEGAKLIRGLFFREDQELHFLPCLPKECPAGRFVDLKFSKGTLSIEWTKKLLRRVVIEPRETFQFKGQFQRDLKSFRVITSKSDPGYRAQVDETLTLEKGQRYQFDNFRK